MQILSDCLAKIKEWVAPATLFVFYILSWGWLAFLATHPLNLPALSAFAVLLGLFNFCAVVGLWIFVLARQFSTHKVVVSPFEASKAMHKKAEYGGEMTDEEKAAKFGAEVASRILNPSKEKLKDSLF